MIQKMVSCAHAVQLNTVAIENWAWTRQHGLLYSINSIDCHNPPDREMLLNLIFPPQCLMCHAIVPTHGTLCLDCWQQVHFISDPCCACCGLPFDYAIGDGALCGDCLQQHPSYLCARAAFRYDDASKSLILKLKYHDQSYLAATYGRWLAKAGGEMLKSCDVIVPVPLYYWRFVQRRYNQSALLAAALARQCALPVIPDALKRIRHTPPQTGLTRAQRHDNVRGVFAVHPKFKKRLAGKRIVLIDDVMTTGATLEACSRALLKAGAGAVYVLTLARTV